MGLTAAKPDVGDIDLLGVPTRATPALAADRTDAFAVVMRAAVRRALQAHADTRHDVEVGGVLVGNVRLDAGGRPYLFVEAGIPALAAESRETNITFTADAWALIHETLDRDHAGASIVGWYHTHPSFGIFLSEMDLFIQRHFFDLPHQVAIVIDPVARTEGCFVWRGGEPTNEPIAIERDDEASGEAVPNDAAERAPIVVADPTGHAFARTAYARRGLTRSICTRGRSALDTLGRLDRSQWAALAALVAIAGVLVGALVVLSWPPAAAGTSATTRNR